MPKFPSVVVGLIIVVGTTALNYFINNVSLFGIPSALAPVLVVLATTAITALQQWKAPEPVAAARGLEQAKARGFVARVLVG